MGFICDRGSARGSSAATTACISAPSVFNRLYLCTAAAWLAAALARNLQLCASDTTALHQQVHQILLVECLLDVGVRAVYAAAVCDPQNIQSAARRAAARRPLRQGAT